MSNEWVVLDWDGTLGYSSLLNKKEDDVSSLDIISTFVKIISLDRNGIKGKTALFLRPNAESFLRRMAQKYNLILWSFGTKDYIEECMDVTGLGVFFQKIIFREMMRHQMKDLFHLNIPMNRVVIVDDSNDAFGVLNPVNCIDIPSWSPYFEDDSILNIMDVLVNYHFKNIMAQYDKHDLEKKRIEIIRNLRTLEQTQRVY